MLHMRFESRGYMTSAVGTLLFTMTQQKMSLAVAWGVAYLGEEAPCGELSESIWRIRCHQFLRGRTLYQHVLDFCEQCIGTYWYMSRTFLLLKIFSGLQSEFCRCLASFGTTEEIKKRNQGALLGLLWSEPVIELNRLKFWGFFQRQLLAAILLYA